MLLGDSTLVPFLGLAVVASSKVYVPFYFASLAGVFWFYNWLLKRDGWLTLKGFLSFGIGWYLQNATIALLLLLKNPTFDAITAPIDMVVL
jgi:hypothetical protein